MLAEKKFAIGDYDLDKHEKGLTAYLQHKLIQLLRFLRLASRGKLYEVASIWRFPF